MPEYIIKKTDVRELSLNSKEWERANAAKIDKANWDEFKFVPETYAYLVYNDEGIYVKFVTDEHPVLVRYKNLNEDVYKDSCVEIFIKPNLNNNNYFNFELNAAGTPLIGYGEGRKRVRLNIDIKQFKIISKLNDKGFELMLFIPFSFLKAFVGELSECFMGNLQKCAEDSENPHFVSFYKIGTQKPDFHAPEFFDKFILE